MKGSSTALFTATTRKGDYFRGEMPFNNATGVVWQTIPKLARMAPDRARRDWFRD